MQALFYFCLVNDLQDDQEYIRGGEEMPEIYRGHKGALRYIADLCVGYDGFSSEEGLKSLIDEIRAEAIEALKLGDDYDALRDAIKRK